MTMNQNDDVRQPANLNPEDLGRVAVLMGGTSAEREVSLKSGAAVASALQAAAVDHVIIDPADGMENLVGSRFDRAFIALHGRGGEDGTIQGVMQLMQRPYTGSGVLASALAMDKLRSKRLWDALGLATPAYTVIDRNTQWQAVLDSMQGPVMVKPAHEGSSIGMRRAESAAELESAWCHASQYDALVLAEQWISGREYTVAVLGDSTLPVIGLQTQRQFYDYEAKYIADDTRYLLPSGLSDDLEAAASKLALQAFQALGCCGWGRTDLMLSEDGRWWLLEVNTVPGMTDHSLVPMAAKAAGLDFSSLVLTILADTLQQSWAGVDLENA